jgi:hypothetical protein
MKTLARIIGGIGLLISVAAYSAPGALIRQAVGQSLVQYAETKMVFQTVTYDDLGFFNPAQPTRLTIPAGVQRAKFTFSTEISFSTQPDSISMIILKNGMWPSGVAGLGRQTFIQNMQSVNPKAMASTAWVPVQPGDYFEFAIHVGVAGKNTSDYTWFAVETE